MLPLPRYSNLKPKPVAVSPTNRSAFLASQFWVARTQVRCGVVNRSFRFNVMSRDAWTRQGGAFLDSPGPSGTVLPDGRFIVVPAGRPSLVSRDGKVLELRAMQPATHGYCG